MLAAMYLCGASSRDQNGNAAWSNVGANALDREACSSASSNASNTKKRHVESMTRLPTKRMATACWDFIVVKRDPLQTAPLLDFSSLQRANRISHPQFIHKCLWMAWGQFQDKAFVVRIDQMPTSNASILAVRTNNRPFDQRPVIRKFADAHLRPGHGAPY
jgi:hypothetical protein